MKKLGWIAAALLAMTGSASAATLSDAFNVTINLTASCQVSTAASDIVFNYKAFDPLTTATTTTVFTCSRGLAPKFSFDSTDATQTGSAAASVGTGITAEGVIAGIRYTLAGTSSKSTNGSAATAGAGGTGGTNGTADAYTVTIDAAIPGGQAGDNTTPTGTQIRTLTITY